MRFISLTLLLAFFVISCKEEQSQAEIDDAIIRQYLDENGLEADKHKSGLYYTMVEIGSGDSPNYFSTVEVSYKGSLITGEVFDETEGDATVQFELKRLIPAWQIGIPLMKRGGKAIMYVPSELGYGPQAIPGIPANSVLIFNMELVDFY